MTTWYREGLITLTAGSDLVAGVGTEWVDSVLPGGIFFTPTGLIEVERVISDGSLKLVTPYAGPSVAGAEYAIAPTQGYVVELARQFNTVLGTFGELKDAWEAGTLVGKGVSLKGVKDTVIDLPNAGNAPGDAWMVDGHLHVWTGSAWLDQGATVSTPELEALRDAAGTSAGLAIGSALAADNTRKAYEDRVYPGVYSSPPTNRPHSGAPSAQGDRCTILVGGVAYEHLRSGGGWLIPNIDAATLATLAGGSMVGVGLHVPTPFLQTVSAIANGDPVSLFRFVDPAKISAIRGFATTYDAAPSMQLACNSGAKRITADYGLFNLESTILGTAPITLEGAGDGTVFNQIGISDRASFHFISTSATDFIDGVRFRNLVFQCLTGTFFEHQHLIALSGVRNVVFELVRMYGFRGDAIYLGSGVGSEERHNQLVRVSSCVFDGINNTNRNAISAIDVDGLIIEDSSFLRCSRPNMPGPIDIEPNSNPWHIVRNITVRRNRFRGNGGNVAEIGFHVPAEVAVPPSNIVIEGNDSDGYIGTGSFFHHNSSRLPIESRIDSDLHLVRNVAKNGCRPWFFSDAKRVRMEANSYSDFSQAACLGFTGGTNGVRDVAIIGDRYTRIGKVGGNGLSIFTADTLSLRETRFVDCGTGVPGAANAIDFNTGTSVNVEMDGVDISAPGGKTLVAIQKEVAHTFSPATNRFIRSVVHGLQNFFAAHESDALESTYLPVVVGSVTAGVGTYTTQFARFRRIGQQCLVRGKLVLTGHTGAGILTVSLPLPVRVSGGTAETTATVHATGVSSTGGQTGLIVQGVAVDGVSGALRLFSQGTGTQANLLIPAAITPAAPVTIYYSLSYLID